MTRRTAGSGFAAARPALPLQAAGPQKEPCLSTQTRPVLQRQAQEYTGPHTGV